MSSHRPRIAILLSLTATVATPADDPPTFVDDVAPILAANCVECHHDGGIGPFPLVTYNEARRRARQIAEVTASGYMPPWKPDREHTPPLQGERTLSAAQIALLRTWLEADAPSGDLAAFTPPPPPSGKWALGAPDLELTFDGPFTVPAEGVDIFRNFVLRIPVERRRYVRAVEFLPESALIVHHAIIAFDPTTQSRELDAAEPGPGFESMDTGGGIHPNGHIIGWTPGQHPYEVFPGTAFAVDPGTDLVLQLHLLPSGRPEQLAPRIGLHFTDEPPTRAGFSLLLREDEIHLPAGSRDVEIAESITLPADAAVLGLYPHAHYLGRDMRLTATLPDGTQRWLLHIPDWDFNWQSDYRYVEPLPLPAGTRIDMRYTYDNSAANPRNPRNPPVDVHAGNSTFDEMGSAVIQLLLEDFADIPKFEETQARYQIDSGEPSADALFNLAVAIDHQGRTADAVVAYQNALAIDPAHVFALNNLASLRERSGEATTALALYRRALEIDPFLVETRLNLARLLLQTGAAADADAVLASGLEHQPDDFELRSALAALQLQRRQAARAVATLEAGLGTHDQDPRLHLQLARALLTQGRIRDARSALETVLARQLSRDGAPAPAATVTLHREARLLLTRLAMMRGDDEAATAQLAQLLALPADLQPSENDLLGELPYPASVPLLARALAARGRSDDARGLLRRHADIARQRGRPAEAAALEALQKEL